MAKRLYLKQQGGGILPPQADFYSVTERSKAAAYHDTVEGLTPEVRALYDSMNPTQQAGLIRDWQDNRMKGYNDDENTDSILGVQSYKERQDKMHPNNQPDFMLGDWKKYRQSKALNPPPANKGKKSPRARIYGGAK